MQPEFEPSLYLNLVLSPTGNTASAHKHIWDTIKELPEQSGEAGEGEVWPQSSG